MYPQSKSTSNGFFIMGIACLVIGSICIAIGIYQNDMFDYLLDGSLSFSSLLFLIIGSISYTAAIILIPYSFMRVLYEIYHSVNEKLTDIDDKLKK